MYNDVQLCSTISRTCMCKRMRAVAYTYIYIRIGVPIYVQSESKVKVPVTFTRVPCDLVIFDGMAARDHDLMIF